MSWIKLDFFRFCSGPRPREFRAAVVALRFGDLDGAVLDAWRCERGDVLERALRVELERLDGLPDGFEVLAIWDEPRWREAHVLVSHPSFEVVKEGHEAPRFASMAELMRRAAE